MKILLLFIMIYYLNNQELFGQKKKLFPGEVYFQNCVANIPTTYKRKSNPKYLKAAKEYENIEIVLARYNRKSSKVIYEYLYIICYQREDICYQREDLSYVFFARPEDYLKDKSHACPMIFIDLKPKFDRFYLAECFNEKLKEHLELKETWNKN